jgi:hypothetical protein
MAEPAEPSHPLLQSAFMPGWLAVRESWKPFLLIQSCAIAVAFAYYLVPGFRTGADALQRIKVAGGLPFAAAATAFAGAILPLVAKRLTLKVSTPVAGLAFQIGFFAVIGITVDLLYKYLAVIFGAEPTPAVVFKKVLCDQFVYSPLVSILLSTVCFSWEEHGFSLARTFAYLSNSGFTKRYVPLLVMCWWFWIPVLTAVYSLPVNLQFILFLCADGAWALLLLTVTASHQRHA